MKIGIVTVAYLNTECHRKMAEAAYDSFQSSYELLKIVVVNHAATKEDLILLGKSNDVVIPNDQNVLGKAWNMGVEEAIKQGCDFIYMPNLDIIADSDTIDELANYMFEKADVAIAASTILGSPTELILGDAKDTEKDIVNHDGAFSSFMIRPSAYEAIGPFYEGFIPCYFEDDDYLWRCLLLGLKAKVIGRSRFFHYVMGTTKLDREVMEKHDERLNRNRIHYIERWGGEPGNEQFILPFNKEQ